MFGFMVVVCIICVVLLGMFEVGMGMIVNICLVNVFLLVWWCGCLIMMLLVMSLLSGFLLDSWVVFCEMMFLIMLFIIG